MEMTSVKKVWARPQVKSSATTEPATFLACSPNTQWDCDPIYFGCGCVPKSADQQTDCDNGCSP